MTNYVCIHGHFYQPPRENPWLESIEVQDSAYPYHDWNERIAAECYGPNGNARILEPGGRIEDLYNNYSRISFNFGPTLLAWMAHAKPLKYQAILDADMFSIGFFGGHGSAIAQVYNHMIMPLANSRDKRTQVAWGIQDFEFRFKRKPEGMWLAETAVDLESLDILAEFGIKFTILAPNQAQSIRRIGEENWTDVSGSRIDPTTPYIQKLPSGREIALFFYDGPISRAIAFEKLLVNGEHLAGRLLGAFSEDREWPQLVHIATDGESYGHHHRHGEMALAYALNHINNNEFADLTIYGEFLEKFPPQFEVNIFENSSWSCVHGIERWRSDCGCNSGGHAWNQGWRGPLRNALDWLRDSLAPIYEKDAAKILKDPWAARDDYCQIILDRSPENLTVFTAKHAKKDLSEGEKTRMLQLMELQRHAMLMYTSCGWFFDELSGIETVQVIMYAGRVVQLAGDLFQKDLETRFLELLSEAKSNIPEHGDGKVIYEKWVKPAMLDLTRVGAHYAISSLFEEYGGRTAIDAYSADQYQFHASQAGRVKVVTGQAEIMSEITHETQKMSFGVLHLGDHNINCGVGPYLDDSKYNELQKDILDAFQVADLPETIRMLDKHFGNSPYSLMSLFKDEQRKVLDLILGPTLNEAEAVNSQFYEHYAPLVRFLRRANLPLPSIVTCAAEYVVNAGLSRAFKGQVLDPGIIASMLEEAQLAGVQLDFPTLEYALRNTMQQIAQDFLEAPEDIAKLQSLSDAVALLSKLPFEVDTWKVQNMAFRVWKNPIFDEIKAKADSGDDEAVEWIEKFQTVLDALWFKMPED